MEVSATPIVVLDEDESESNGRGPVVEHNELAFVNVGDEPSTTLEPLEVSVDVEPLIAVEKMGDEVILGDEGDGEASVPQDLIVEEIKYSTPDGKSHSLSQYSGAIEAPCVGMTFETWEMVESYFRTYGKQNGFGVVRGASAYRQKNGKATTERRSVRWECEFYGTKDNRVRVNGKKVTVSKMHCVGKAGLKLSTRSTKKCQCPVHVYASASRDAKLWVIKKAVLEHEGHTPTPSKVRHVSMLRQAAINVGVRKKLFTQLEAGIKIPQIHRAMALERNGLENMPFTERDLRNVVAKQKRMKMEVEGGDAQAMVNYLKQMAADNDKFFHAERVDEGDRLKDVMWVDARSRVAYEDFGDVVCFDTTYITNKFKLPFANFVGVNHHGQTILFGCALLSHENAETFEWLFERWLCCMGGKAPAGFLTDQCAAMRKAIAKVMPQSRHRWCLWHILQKFSTKLGAYKDYELFKDELHNVIYDSLSVEEFKVNWCEVIAKYDLQTQDWLQGLFLEQHMWAPAHMKEIFWAGMKTTQRSESINSFFDGYVKKQTLLYEFISQYFAALEARAYAEDNADADSTRTQQELVTQFPIEEEFRKLYTKAKLVDFQKECLKLMYVNQTSCWKVNDNVIAHRIDDQIWHRCKNTRKEYPTEKYCHYVVMLDVRTNNCWCACKLFESHGIMCRHIVRVFAGRRLRKLPEMFILQRWRKDIVRRHTKVKVRHHDLSKTEEVKRYDEIMVEFEPLALLGARNEEFRDEVIGAVRKSLEGLKNKIGTASRSKEADNQIENFSPSSVNKKIVSLGDGSSPSSVKNIHSGSNKQPSGHVDIVNESNGSTELRNTIETGLPDFIKDPPLPKMPKHRTTSSRFKSAAETSRSRTGKSTGRGRGRGRGDELAQAQIMSCSSQTGYNNAGEWCAHDVHQQQQQVNQQQHQLYQQQLVFQQQQVVYQNPGHEAPPQITPVRAIRPRPVYVYPQSPNPPFPVVAPLQGRSVGSIVLSTTVDGSSGAATVAYGTRNLPPQSNVVPEWMRGVVSGANFVGGASNQQSNQN